jgi:hypothetical protein
LLVEQVEVEPGPSQHAVLGRQQPAQHVRRQQDAGGGDDIVDLHCAHAGGLRQLGGLLARFGQGQLEAGGRADLGVEQPGEYDAEDDEAAAEDQQAHGVDVVAVRLEERCDEEYGAQQDEDNAAGTTRHADMIARGWDSTAPA